MGREKKEYAENTILYAFQKIGELANKDVLDEEEQVQFDHYKNRIDVWENSHVMVEVGPDWAECDE